MREAPSDAAILRTQTRLRRVFCARTNHVNGAVAPLVCHPERSEGSHSISGCSLAACRGIVRTARHGCQIGSSFIRNPPYLSAIRISLYFLFLHFPVQKKLEIFHFVQDDKRRALPRHAHGSSTLQ